MSVIFQTCKLTKRVQVRSLFHWINLQFNAIDDDRLKTLGPDRVCSEWILRNGGKVKLVGAQDYEFCYNNLPKEEIPIKLQEIDASGSSIMTNGFVHLKGCTKLSKIILHECNLLENEGLKELRYVKDSLVFLQISQCGNISDTGLLHLTGLSKLSTLIIRGLPYVKDRGKTLDTLKNHLTQCKITFEE